MCICNHCHFFPWCRKSERRNTTLPLFFCSLKLPFRAETRQFCIFFFLTDTVDIRNQTFGRKVVPQIAAKMGSESPEWRCVPLCSRWRGPVPILSRGGGSAERDERLIESNSFRITDRKKKKSSLITLANHTLADTSWGQAPYLQLGHSFSLTFDMDWSLNYNNMMVFDQNECSGIKRKPQRCLFVLIARTRHSILGCCDTLRMTCSLPMRFDCTTLTTQRCNGDYKDYTVDSTMLPLCIYIHSCFATWNANMAFIIILRHSCCPLYQ